MTPAPDLTEATLSTLHELRTECLRSEAGFRSCASQCQADDVRALLRRRAEDSRAAASELQAHVHRLDKRAPAHELDDGDKAALAWQAVRSTLASHTDLALLEACERQEDTALERYTDALTRELEPAAREAIDMQRLNMRSQHELLRAMRDRLRGLSP